MKIPRDVMLDILDSGEVIQNQITGHSRWSVHHSIVFKHEGSLYATTYSVGATECQDEAPFMYERDGVDCVPVVAVEKTVTVYEPIMKEEK